jgi:protoporphyrinogen oxidase
MNCPNRDNHLTILGAGIAGLSAGYYAKKAGFPFTILESSNDIGGNCRTIKHEGFSFDTGAHRFHDKDPAQTREIKSLLGDEIQEICVPSRIYHKGVFLDFPLSLSNLVRELGFPFLFKAAFEVLRSRLAPRSREINFEEFAYRAYGKTIAEFFLLGYSQKLWGVPPHRLSPVVSGGRLKGLNLATFLREQLNNGNNGAKHLDGSFYYPSKGIQSIPEALGNSCGRDHIRTGSRITRVFHDARAVRAVEVNGRDRLETDRVISTLPLTTFLGMLDPPPPAEIARLAGRLKFRELRLCALFLNKPSVSKCASFYFPDPRFPFSRVYEPKNRSVAMAPRDKTALVAEFPCQRGDAVWKAADAEILEMTGSALIRIGLIREADILDGLVIRLGYAYPVIERQIEETIRPIFRYLGRFENLNFSGRGACFEYLHMHDLMGIGQKIIDGLARAEDGAFLGDPGQPQQAPQIDPPILDIQASDPSSDVGRPEIE